MPEVRNAFEFDQNPLVQRGGTITSRNFLPNVFLWMFIALGLSAGFAYFFSTDAACHKR